MLAASVVGDDAVFRSGFFLFPAGFYFLTGEGSSETPGQILLVDGDFLWRGNEIGHIAVCPVDVRDDVLRLGSASP